MTEEERRMQILEMIELGEISAEEGLRMIHELTEEKISKPFKQGKAELRGDSEEKYSDAPKPSEVGADEPVQPAKAGASYSVAADSEPVADQHPDTQEGTETEGSFEAAEAEIFDHGGERSWPAEAEKWRRWWMIPLWIGVGIVAVAGLLMLWAFQASGFGFWFICSSVILAFGLVILVLAAQSRTARWLHLRVRQKPGQRPQTIAISLPIPLRFARWILRIFGGFVPDMRGASMDDILMALDALEQSATPDNPVFIEVDEEDGERVEIYIG